MTLDARSIRALSFDCYGTLIDWESGIWDALQPLFLRHPDKAPSREAALQAFSAIEPEIERMAPRRPYEMVLADAHARIAAQFGCRSSSALDAAFGESLPHWPAFPDSASALRRLAKRFKLLILSNVSNEGIRASVRKLGVSFDALYTAEDIGSYKPDLANFKYLLDHLDTDHGLPPTALVHVAESLFHDHVPARMLGLRTAWIDRRGLSTGAAPGATRLPDAQPDVTVTVRSLAAFADALLGPEAPVGG